MKAIVVGLFAIAFVGCATVQPYKVSEASAKDATAAFDCALGIATSMDYTPEQVSKESGFFKAERNYRPGASSIRLGGQHDGRTGGTGHERQRADHHSGDRLERDQRRQESSLDRIVQGSDRRCDEDHAKLQVIQQQSRLR